MTVPADHVVMATGQGQNYQQVLSPAQFARWQKAQTATEVTEIATLDEAKARENKNQLKRKHGYLKLIWYVILPGAAAVNLYGMPCRLK